VGELIDAITQEEATPNKLNSEDTSDAYILPVEAQAIKPKATAGRHLRRFR
jgi:hypothetical protein